VIQRGGIVESDMWYINSSNADASAECDENTFEKTKTKKKKKTEAKTKTKTKKYYYKYRLVLRSANTIPRRGKLQSLRNKKNDPCNK